MKRNLKITLRNEKVILRPLELTDEVALRTIAQERELWTYGIKDLSSHPNLRRYIENAIRDREQGVCAVWVIVDAASGRVAGCTRLAEISWNDKRGQIGWTWIGKDFQGTGLNKAAKYEILKFGFEELHLNRIEFKADERNIRSRKAIVSIGATEEGILRQHMKLHDGHIRNTVFYSILQSEWEDIKNNIFSNYLRIES